MIKSYDEQDLQQLVSVFNGDHFSISIFKKLLEAVTSNDFSKLGKTPAELTYVYFLMRSKVESFIMNHIYEPIYESNAYVATIAYMVDLYSVYMTVIFLRRNITDIDIQPDEIVDAYLGTFGFPSSHLFNYIQKREIVRNIYHILRRKGTPEILGTLLLHLGFTNFYISEFWLRKLVSKPTSETEEDNPYSEDDANRNYRFVPDVIYKKTFSGEEIAFATPKGYTIPEIEEQDPLWLLTEKDLDLDPNVVFPAKSPYYQLGVTVSDSILEKTLSAFMYAMIKRTKYAAERGFNVYVLPFEDFIGKISFVDLANAWAYVMGETFGKYDPIIEISKKRPRFDIGIKFDSGYRFDTGTATSRPTNYKFDTSNLFDSGLKFDTVNLLSMLTEYTGQYVFGWNGDVYNKSVKQIMEEIRIAIKETMMVIPSLPDVRGDSPLIRKMKKLIMIEVAFYNKPIYPNYASMVSELEYSNSEFKSWLDYQMNLYPHGSEEDFQTRVRLLQSVLETIEYFIFDHTKIRLNVSHLLMTYSQTYGILSELDKSFTPYHAKMLDPSVFHVIRDLPGDCICFDDTYMELHATAMLREVYWRSSTYARHDIPIPEPYNPITDWIPDIPSELIWVPGYDWNEEYPFPTTFSTKYNLIVNRKPFYPKFDFIPDKMQTEGIIDGIISGYRMNKPPQTEYDKPYNPYDETEFSSGDLIKKRHDKRIHYDHPDVRDVNTIIPRQIDFQRFDMPVIRESMVVIHEKRS